jgi:hypothetical protein
MANLTRLIGSITDSKFWLDLIANSKLGHYVTLSDRGAAEADVIAEQLHGVKADGRREYTLDSCVTVLDPKSGNGVVWCRMRDNIESAQDLYLLALCAGPQAELFAFFDPGIVQAGNRAQQIEAGATWLFSDSDASANPASLAWKKSIAFPRVGDEGDITYTQTGFSLSAIADFNPEYCGGTEHPVTFTMYATGDETPYPRLVIMEIGGDGSQGGDIMMLFGNPLQPHEVEIINPPESLTAV